jgi:hypothetical protein
MSALGALIAMANPKDRTHSEMHTAKKALFSPDLLFRCSTYMAKYKLMTQTTPYTAVKIIAEFSIDFAPDITLICFH